MIPIKEKSQRVPGKTFRVLGDKPLAFWVVDSLLRSKYIKPGDIWINTDSLTVVKLFTDASYDISYYIRPESVRGHDVSMNKVIDDWIRKEGQEYSYYLQTHITNPFISTDLFDRAIELEEYYAQGSHKSIMGVTRHQCRMWHQDVPVNFNLGEVIPTQDLIPCYEDNSCFYIFDYPCFYQFGRVSPSPEMIEVPFPQNIDIDTEDDWQLAEIVSSTI